MSAEDKAQDIELRAWEAINLTKREEAEKFEPGNPGYGPEECVECGSKMPAERRAWGYELCVPCKTLTERPRR